MARSTTESGTDDYLDVMTAVLAFDSFRRHRIPALAAAVLAAGVLIADAIQATKAGS